LHLLVPSVESWGKRVPAIQKITKRKDSKEIKMDSRESKKIVVSAKKTLGGGRNCRGSL